MATTGPDPMTTDNQIKQTIQQVKPPVVSPSYLSDHVKIGRERCRQRLKRLSDEGDLSQDRLGQTPVYWLSD